MVRGHWANLARMPGLHPNFFSMDILGFLITKESQDLGLTSLPKDGAFYSIVSPSIYWGVTDHRVSTPLLATLTPVQQQPSFPRRSPIQVLTRPNPA